MTTFAGPIFPAQETPGPTSTAARPSPTHWVMDNRWIAVTLSGLLVVSLVLIVLVSISIARRKPQPSMAQMALTDGRITDTGTLVEQLRLAVLEQANVIRGIQESITSLCPRAASQASADEALAFRKRRTAPPVIRVRPGARAHRVPNETIPFDTPCWLYVEQAGLGTETAVVVLPHVAPSGQSLTLTLDCDCEVPLTTFSYYALMLTADGASLPDHGVPQDEGLRPRADIDNFGALTWGRNPAIFLGAGAGTLDLCRFIFLRGVGTQLRLTCNRITT